jgi:hypothetical protein
MKSSRRTGQDPHRAVPRTSFRLSRPVAGIAEMRSDFRFEDGHDELRLISSSICQIFIRRNCQIVDRR